MATVKETKKSVEQHIQNSLHIFLDYVEDRKTDKAI